MIRRLILLIATLLCVTPSFAVKDIREGATASSSRFEATFQNGDAGDVGAVTNTCGAWAISFFEGEGLGADVEIFGSRDNTSANGVSLATIAATTATPVVVRTSFPYVVVNIDAAPASGTARVYMVCSASAAGGGAAAVASLGGRFWADAANASVDVLAGECFHAVEGDSVEVTPEACAGAAEAEATDHYVVFPVGRQVVAKHLSCVASAAVDPDGSLTLELRWRSGGAVTFTESVAALVITGAQHDALLRSVPLDSQCPYASAGCLATVRVRAETMTTAVAVQYDCDVLFEVS